MMVLVPSARWCSAPSDRVATASSWEESAPLGGGAQSRTGLCGSDEGEVPRTQAEAGKIGQTMHTA